MNFGKSSGVTGMPLLTLWMASLRRRFWMMFKTVDIDVKLPMLPLIFTRGIRMKNIVTTVMACAV